MQCLREQGNHAVSYRIAAEMIENMEEKEFLDLDTPMTKDRQILNQNYEKAAKRIIEELEKGKDVAYLTLEIQRFIRLICIFNVL